MASVTTLKLKMGTLSGSKTFSFKYANPSVNATKVQKLAQALIDNGSVYVNAPQVLESASVEVTETRTIDVD